MSHSDASDNSCKARKLFTNVPVVNAAVQKVFSLATEVNSIPLKRKRNSGKQ